VLERRHEVGFVKDDQRIYPEQPGVIRPHLPRHAIALEQQARADHVHRANDNRWCGGIIEPLAVVDVLAAQGRDRKRLIFA